ncbi:hypothetical protein M3G03_09935 [Aestuariimicrobium sp. p3-SID1156]|uniref:hypothetical protein n=1 Tax=Aestuariimicrobium sp. p3-SID1156 TaxID=2916038 RepID=UPI00223AED96|nr:hypothetical protein [Aestuariimicrobium sp. p3-SID1156]MCT1459849.1 hypothetical protein [Aestuariimicrobium sp. p3-SID1156]
MDFLQSARAVKHRAFVASKHARWAARDAKLWLDDRRWAAAEGIWPLQYANFPHTFLARSAPMVGELQPAPPILWACWMGGDLSENRRRSLEGLRAQAGLEFRLVERAEDVELPDAPFHPAYPLLSAVHKSDYVRAYVMHHFGGVYADVKPLPGELRPVLDLLNGDDSRWVVAYREVTSNYVPDLPHELGVAIRRHYRSVMGPSGFGFRPGTAFTAEWMRELHARLDYFSGALAEVGGGFSPYTQPAGYPIRWSEILADIIQPLSMKHQRHVVFTDGVRPVLRGYR